jgi:2-succinyl-6-hydroxy-2,4-cyclohexadiene-1-carboxylate synthase
MPRVLLLHGFTGSAASWQEAADRLEAGGVTAHALDLPGHGHRTGEREAESFTLPAVVQEIDRALRDGAGDAGPATDGVWLLGYSMGGRIALHYALQRPDRIAGLILESASPGLDTPDERSARRSSDETLAAALESEGIEAFVNRWESLPLFATQRSLPEADRRAERLARLSNDPDSLAASLRGLGTGRLPSLWGRLEEVALPVLILVGALDPKFVEIGERMADLVPGAALTAVPDAGHNVHLERPAEWCRAVTDFITGGWRRYT